MKKKLYALIAPLLSVLVLSMFASTYVVPTVSANNSYEFSWDVYLDYTYGFPPTVIEVESNLEWIEQLDYTTPVYIIDDGVIEEDGVWWYFQHYLVHQVLVADYKLSGTFDNHFIIYWKLPWEWPLPTENYGYQWFEDGTGYFEGIQGEGQVLVEWHELELPPNDPLKIITWQHSWGTVNIGDYE